MKALTNSRLNVFWALFLSLLLAACSNDEPQKANSVAPQPEVESKVQTPQEPKLPAKPRWERYGDEAIFSTPRMQFTAKQKGEPSPSVWSMRLDGSDRRLAADLKLMKNAHIVHKPVRSPNNRYIAASVSDTDDNDKFKRMIIDLKEQKRFFIQDGGGYPEFNWSANSENLYFYSDGKFYRYHLPTQELTKKKTIYSNGLTLLPDDKTFLARETYGYSLYTLEGKQFKTVNFVTFGINIRGDDHSFSRFKISPDGNMMFFSAQREEDFNSYIYWLDIQSGKLLGNADEENNPIGNAMFSDKPNTLYYFRHSAVIYIELPSLEWSKVEVKERRAWDMGGISQLSLINYQAAQ